MSQRARELLKRCGLTAGAGALVGVVIFFLRGGFGSDDPVRQFVALCDAFTLPGVFLLMISGLIFMSGEGVFDGVSFIVRQGVRTLIPGARAREEPEKYGDYVEQRRAKGKPKGYACLLLVGIVYLLMGVILTVIYYSIYDMP